MPSAVYLFTPLSRLHRSKTLSHLMWSLSFALMWLADRQRQWMEARKSDNVLRAGQDRALLSEKVTGQSGVRDLYWFVPTKDLPSVGQYGLFLRFRGSIDSHKDQRSHFEPRLHPSPGCWRNYTLWYVLVPGAVLYFRIKCYPSYDSGRPTLSIRWRCTIHACVVCWKFALLRCSLTQ